MAKKYYVWADANCNGENIEWIELTFLEFKEFRKRPENKQRKFIELSDHLFHECDTVFIEATQEQYREWKKEDNHLYYIHTVEEEFIQYSFDFSMNDEDELTLHDLIPNEESTDFIEEIESCSTAESFMHAFSQLSDSEKEFLTTYVSLINEGNSERAVCRILGIPKSTYRDRKEKILKKLKKFRPIADFFREGIVEGYETFPMDIDNLIHSTSLTEHCLGSYLRQEDI